MTAVGQRVVLRPEDWVRYDGGEHQVRTAGSTSSPTSCRGHCSASSTR